MVTTKRIIIGVLLLAAAYVGYKYIFVSEERKIRKQFDIIAKSIAREPGENPLSIAGKLRIIEKLFLDPCKIEAPAYAISKIYSRQEITQLGLTVLTYYSKLSVSFYDMKIMISDDQANIVTTLKITGRLANGEEANDVQELECNMTKFDKDWLFREFKLVDVLKK